MHVEVINFNLEDMTDEEWHEVGKGLVDAYNELPGLLAKIWIENTDRNVFGGIYLWRDKESMEAFHDGWMGERIRNNPKYANVTFNDFHVVDELTKATQPVLQML
jgi:hypothetical protein